MADRMSKNADGLRYITQQMENYNLEKIEVKRYKSWRDGMPMVAKFCESADEALYETLERMGKYNASKKKDSPKKKKRG